MKYYCFLWRRGIDTKAWPSIFLDKKLAEDYQYRVSPVVEVEIEPDREPVVEPSHA